MSKEKRHFAQSNLQLLTETQQDKTNKMICAPSEDTDQPGRPPSPISLRYLHEEALGP